MFDGGFQPLKDDNEGLWGKEKKGLGITDDQVKIEESSMIQTTRVLSVEVEKIGDIGRTADLLKTLFDPVDIFLKVSIRLIGRVEHISS